MQKKGVKKGTKKGRCERPGLGPPFSTLFGSLSPLHAAWVFISFLKGHMPPRMFKKDLGEFFWIL
jgi:hypothetical protein